MQHTGYEPKALSVAPPWKPQGKSCIDVQSDEVRPAALSGAGRNSPDSAMGEPDYGLSLEQTAGLFQDELGSNPNQEAAGVFDQQQDDVDHQVGPRAMRPPCWMDLSLRTNKWEWWKANQGCWTRDDLQQTRHQNVEIKAKPPVHVYRLLQSQEHLLP